MIGSNYLYCTLYLLFSRHIKNITMNITYLGHSSLKIEANGKSILVDPFISANPRASHIDVNNLECDYILITHAHYDHIMDVEALATRTNALIISNHEIVTYYEGKGLKGHGMNHGGTWNFDFGSIKMVNAIHSSSFPDGANGGNPAGFVLSSEGKHVYIAGDTALTMDMKLIPLFFKLDLAILPVGGNFTMDINEALYAAEFVECNNIMGVHFDTAPYIEIQHEEAKAKFSAKGKTLNLLSIGDSLAV